MGQRPCSTPLSRRQLRCEGSRLEKGAWMNAARTTPTADSVRALMPQLRQELAELVAIPCVSASGYPEETHAPPKARDFIVELLRDAGVEQIDSLELPGHRADHHGRDLQPPTARRPSCSTGTTTSSRPATTKWESPPSRPPSATARSTVAARPTPIEHPRPRRRPPRLERARPPVGVKIVIEGQEEIGSAFTTFPPTKPELFGGRRDGDRGHGQPPAGGADADDRAARGRRV